MSNSVLESLKSLNPKQVMEKLAALPQEKRDQLTKLVMQADQRCWVPFPASPQRQAYYSLADELFYGGAQGGGKSDLVLGLAATQHWNSVILRREFPMMRNLIERSRQIYNAEGRSHSKDSYNESTHIWRLLSGRIVEFTALQYDKDKEDQRGRPRDFYGWDEICQFTEGQYRFVNAWNRTSRPGQRCRIVATGNPPTSSEGEWVIRYWAPWIDSQYPYPAEPGELRWFARVDNKDEPREDNKPFKWKGETIIPRSRTFIPALLGDNPVLDNPESGYRALLQSLPEPLRSQALYGDFSIGLTDDAWQVIPTAWIRAAQKRWTELAPQRMTSMGVDPAHGGAAQTVISRRHGRWFAPLLKWPGRETPEGPHVARLVAKYHEAGADINIDAIGYGASAYEFLKRDFDYLQANIRPVNEGAKCTLFDRSGRYPLANVRTALYWKLREALDPEHGDNLALPPDPEMVADLCAARYELSASGIKVEAKDKIEERVGRVSVDCGDAVMLAHWMAQGGMVPDAGMLEAADRQARPRDRWDEAQERSRSAERGHFGRGDR